MNHSGSQTLEQALFGRMGISVDDAMATGADAIDETVARAARSGVDVDERIKGLGGLLEKLSEPATVSAIGELVDSLPQLAQLAKLASSMPNVVAMLVDVVDEFQQRCDADGVDIERALANGLQAALWLGSKVDHEHLMHIGDLLDSDILNPHAVRIVNNAAQSLTSAQQHQCEKPSQARIGMLGLLGALRNPEIQRSLAFAVQFGKCFGKNLDRDPS